MIVVRIPVALVHGDVQLVGSFNQVQTIDRKGHLIAAFEPLRRHLFEIRVRPVTTDAVGVEQAHAEDEVVGRLRSPTR